jgi:ABC-type multidrug transport system permease subunit
MKTVLGILSNDIRRRLKNPLSIILMLLIPVSMTLIVGIVFGPEGDVGMPEIKVLLVDEDGSFFSGFLKRGLEQGELGEMLDVTEVASFDGREMMEDGKASAMIVIPDSFSVNILDGRPVELKVVKNPSEFFLPVVVEEITKTMAVLLDGATRVFNEPVAKMRSIADGDSWPEASDMQVVMDGAKNGIILASAYVTDSLITLSDVTEAPAEGDEDGEGNPVVSDFNIFAYVMPGSMMIGLLFIVELVLRDLLRERRGGTLRRMLASPATAGQVVAGKVGATFAITLIACVILLLVSGLGFRVDLGDPLALTVHTLAVILMCTGLMTFLYGAISNERAADAVMSVVIIVMALFGGSLVPIEQMPAALRAAGRFSPVYWASDGMKQIFLLGAGIPEISAHLLILSLLGVFTIVPGTLLIRGRALKGGE